MKYKKKLLLTLSSLFILSYYAISQTKGEAVSQKKTQIIDHAHDYKKAKKWAENNYQDWNKKLAPEEKKSLLKLLEPIDKEEEKNMDNINYQLKVYGGNLSDRPIDIPTENKILANHINHISRAINRDEGKLKKPLIVYKNEPLEEIIHTQGQTFKNADGSLNKEKVKQLRTTFSMGQHSEFRIYDLFEDPEEDEMVKWRIELPAGTSTGLIDGDKIVINKNSAFKVNAIKVIPGKGKYLLRIDAKLIPKSIVENEVTHLTNKLRKNFIKLLQLPKDKKIINFKLNGSGSQYIAHKLGGLIDKFILNIDNKIIKRTLEFMSRKGGSLLFTDRKVYTLPEIYHPFPRTLKELNKMLAAVGFYHVSGNRTLAINVPTNLKINKNSEIHRLSLFHEFGHAVDHYGGNILRFKFNEISNTPEFSEIFEEEGENLTEYGSKNKAEFFAEAFRMMHSPNGQEVVKQNAPETYSIIEKVLDVLAKIQIQNFA